MEEIFLAMGFLSAATMATHHLYYNDIINHNK